MFSDDGFLGFIAQGVGVRYAHPFCPHGQDRIDGLRTNHYSMHWVRRTQTFSKAQKNDYGSLKVVQTQNISPSPSG